MSEPVVSGEDFAAGPPSLPGLPGIPAPEFCSLGTVTWPPAGGVAVCAEADSVTTAIAAAKQPQHGELPLYDMKAEACPIPTIP